MTIDSIPAAIAFALKGFFTLAILTAGQFHALGAIGPQPAELAHAHVGLRAIAPLDDALGVADGRVAEVLHVGEAGQAEDGAVARTNVVVVSLVNECRYYYYYFCFQLYCHFPSILL